MVITLEIFSEIYYHEGINHELVWFALSGFSSGLKHLLIKRAVTVVLMSEYN